MVYDKELGVTMNVPDFKRQNSWYKVSKEDHGRRHSQGDEAGSMQDIKPDAGSYSGSPWSCEHLGRG